MRFVWPKGLAGQLIAAILLVLVVVQVVTLYLYADERRTLVRRVAQSAMIERTAALVRLLNSTPSRFHQEIINSASGPRLLFWLSTNSIATKNADAHRIHRVLERQLGKQANDIRVDVRPTDGNAFRRLRRQWENNTERGGPTQQKMQREVQRIERSERAGKQRLERHKQDSRRGKQRHRRRPLVDILLSVRPREIAQWLNVETLVPPATPPWAQGALQSLLITMLLVSVLVVAIVRHATRPLRALSEAAEKFGRGDQNTHVLESGPQDVRNTIRAFNEMRERLSQFVRSRTQMLAAVSHDLRTPLTTMRLRAEMVADDCIRDKLVAALDEMQEMVEATLTFVQQDATAEQLEQVDLTALIDNVHAESLELGQAVDADIAAQISLRCKPIALRRALRNIINNAVSYGTRATISLHTVADCIIISVEDDGPGIAEEAIDRVRQPFVRLEESRNRDTGGVGMGLAIADSIVSAHGGVMRLSNRSVGGLRVVFEFKQ